MLRGRDRRATKGLALALAAGLVAWLPRLLAPADGLAALEKLGFELAQFLAPERRASEVAVIEMDQVSFRARGQDTAPLWDRSLHAQLVRNLKRDGARVIVFDVVFDKPTSPEADRELADAIRDHGKVAIAGLREAQSGHGVSGYQTILPIDPLRTAAAGVGMVNIQKDRDGAVRRPFIDYPDRPGLPRVAAQLAGAANLPEPGSQPARWLRHYGPPAAALPRMSYTDALDQPEGHFQNKFVFIGGALRVKRPGEPVDFFRTAYTRWDGVESPGVALVAIDFLNLVRGDTLTRSSVLVELLALLLVAALAALLCTSGSFLQGTLLAAVLCAGAAAAGFASQAWGRIIFPWIAPAAVVVPVAWAWAMATGVAEKRRHLIAPAAQPQVAPPAADPSAKPTLVAGGPATALVAKIPDHTLLRAVGRGAYGEVWLARNAIGLFHAVKIIYRREFADSAPYEREFRGVTKFMPISRSHPGFVNILHVGRDDALGCFYCIMEAADDEVAGAVIAPDSYSPRSLARHLRRHRRLPAQEVLDLGLQLAAALNHLHQARLIHRDIKPGNIIFVHGVAKLADIGLVTDLPKEPGAATYLGTMGYIAPEGPGTPLADIYSLGKVLYECFTGLDREAFPNLPTSLLAEPDASSFRLNQIVLKACEPNPKRRYPSAAQLHADLEALRKRLGGAG